MRVWTGVWIASSLAWVGCDDPPQPSPEPTSASEQTATHEVTFDERVVPQVRPAHVGRLAWLDADTVVAAHGPIVYQWHPESGRVLAVDHLAAASSPIVVSSAGMLYGAGFWRHETASWTSLGTVDPWATTLSPTFDRVALLDSTHGDRALVVRDLDGGHEQRVPIGEVSIAFSPDGASIATCGPRGVELRDARTLAWRAGWQGPSGACAWGPAASPIVSVSEGSVVLLDPDGLTPIGDPITLAVRSVGIARDGRHVALGVGEALAVEGDRAGVSIREVASGRELAFVEMRTPTALVIEGDRVAWSDESWGGVGRGGILDLEGHDVLVARDGFDAGQLSPRGDVVEIADGEVVVTTVEGSERRWLGPRDASLEVVDDRLRARIGPHPWFASYAVGVSGVPTVFASIALPSFETRVFGACPTLASDGQQRGAARSFPLTGADGEGWVGQGCLARADGTSRELDVQPVAARGGLVVSTSPNTISVLGLDGEVRATLALDRREVSPCATASCRVPFEIAPDASTIVMARGSLLRAFDAGTGARLGRANVAERTRQLLYLGADRLVHVGEDGVRTLFAMPTLSPLARWEGPLDRGRDPLFALDGGVLDASLLRWSLRDREGRELASQPAGVNTTSIRARGASIAVQIDDETRVYDATTLAVIATLPARLRGVGPREVYTCADGVMVRHVIEGASVLAHPTTAPCGDGLYLEGGWLMVHAADGDHLVAPGGRHARVVAGLEGDTLRVALLDDEGAHGDALLALAPSRAPEAQRAPAQVGDLASWSR
ncbi:MAG: hypothetical protein J0L92_04115 [Deltaproteobacteria bacterium]|nr:hypothetical protein [Deltaproteobacteria bacterium]